MNEVTNRRIDILSLGLGLVAGAILLAIYLHQTEPQPSAGTNVDRTMLDAISSLERERTNHVQSLLDGIVGVGNSVARVSISDWKIPGETPVIKRLTLAVGVDHTKVILNPQTDEVLEMIRPQEEIDLLLQLAESAAGFDSARGDESTVFGMPFDKTAQIIALTEQSTGQRRRLVLTVALVALAGIIAFVTRGRRHGRRTATVWLASGLSLVLMVADCVSPRDAIILGVGLYLAISGWTSLRQASQ